MSWAWQKQYSHVFSEMVPTLLFELLFIASSLAGIFPRASTPQCSPAKRNMQIIELRAF